MRVTASVCFGALLLFAALAMGGAQPPPRACDPWQSHRNVKTDRTSRESIVVRVSSDQKKVWVRGRTDPLVLCGQHYHAPVENVQGCKGETEVISAPPAKAGDAPGPGQWIEVHTVYAPRFDTKCDKYKFQTLDCCLGVTAQDPALVRGFSAKVVPGPPGVPGPGLPSLIPTPGGRPLAEWTGSNTGPDDMPGECLPTPALWSFRLADCKSPPGITQTVLREFQCPGQAKGGGQKCGWQGARSLQAGPRVSDDLRRVPK
jgi:hypothetical protein